MPRLLTPIIIALLVAPAAARDCRDAIFENQRHARIIEHGLRQLDAFQADVAALEAHNDAVFVEPGEPWRATAAFSLASQIVALGQRCHDPMRFDQSALSAPGSLMGAIVYKPAALRLAVFTLGRMDVLRLQTSAPDEPLAEIHGQYRGVVGVQAQVTRWIAVGIARVGTVREEGDDPALQGIFADEPPGPSWLYEIGIPAAGLTARLTAEGDTVLLREAAVRKLAITDRLSLGAEWAALATEDRHVITPRADYVFIDNEDEPFRQGLEFWGEVAIETNEIGLRHLRIGLRSPMLSSKVTRTSWSRIGVEIAQRAAASVHTGAQLQAASEKSAAVGGQWDMALTMRTPYLSFSFDFGIGFNVPEMLDLYPGLANSLTLGMGIRVGNHW